MTVIIKDSAPTPAKAQLCFDVNNSIIESRVNSVCTVFDNSIIVIAPAPIRLKAGKSYLQINFSPRHLIERNVLYAIAVIEFEEMRTISA